VRGWTGIWNLVGSCLQTSSCYSSQVTVWRLVTHHTNGENGEKYPQWAEEAYQWCLEEKRIALGWGETGDVRGFESPEAVVEFGRSGPYASLHNVGQCGRQLWSLCHEMQVGDLVILSTGEYRAVAYVKGEYEYSPDRGQLGHDYYHQRAVHITPLPAKPVWDLADGLAEGQSPYLPLVRCARSVKRKELDALL